MSTELEVSIEKKEGVFEKTTIVFLNIFVREKAKLYLNTSQKILVNGPWRLDFMVPQRSLLLSWLNT